MDTSTGLLQGVLEGFYGKPWSHSLRLAYAGYLRRAGLNCYLYCPKSDALLRRAWRRDWPQEEWQRLSELAREYRREGILFGVGLSPYELYQCYGADDRKRLRTKLQRLAELEMPLLAILFDDMPGDQIDLAERQVEIVTDIAHWLGEVRLLVCPTYYSYDPVLERYFGPMPDRYWQQLGEFMPAAVDLFWTGNTVCAERIEAADLHEVAAVFSRPPVLWDNYPVNDGAIRSRYLYTEPLPGRNGDVASSVRGHLCNPMNQGLISLPALMGLTRLYGLPGLTDADLAGILGAQTWRCLQRDGPMFQTQGLDGMGPEVTQRLAAEYGALPGNAAVEVAGWLREEYKFDPACLTD